MTSESGNKSICSPVPSSSAERSSRRHVVKFVCAVETCRNDDKTVGEDGEAVRFFQMPSTDRKVRQMWENAVPGIRDAALPQHRKVCEEHFTERKPTKRHPAPELKLGDEAPQFLLTPKEKLDAKRAKKKASKALPEEPSVKEECQKNNSKQQHVTIKIPSSVVQKSASVSPDETRPSGQEERAKQDSDSQCSEHTKTPAEQISSNGGRKRARQESQAGAEICMKCAVSLPAMKRGLGRLESSLDTMVTMVRTIFLQQTGVIPSFPAKAATDQFSSAVTAEQIVKDIAGPSPGVASVRVSTSDVSHQHNTALEVSVHKPLTTVSVAHQLPAETTGKKIEPVLPSVQDNKKETAPIVSFSEIPVGKPKVASITIPSPVVKKIALPKKVVLPPGFVLKPGPPAGGNKTVRILVKSGDSYAIKSLSNGNAPANSGSKSEKIDKPDSSPTFHPIIGQKRILPAGNDAEVPKSAKVVLDNEEHNGVTLNGDIEKHSLDLSGKESSKDTPSPEYKKLDDTRKQETEEPVKVLDKPAKDPKYYLTNAVARSMLLHSGTGFALPHLISYGPLWLPKVPRAKLESVADQLVYEKLLESLGSRKIEPTSADPEGKGVVYRRINPEKLKTDPDLLKRLTKYGVSIQAYTNSFMLRGVGKFPKVESILSDSRLH